MTPAPAPLTIAKGKKEIEQVVRLVRSKGVGVYFATQNPMDIPDRVLGQLGNRVQHALRAFSPNEQKAVKAAAGTFRANPKLDVVKANATGGSGGVPAGGGILEASAFWNRSLDSLPYL